MDVFLWMVCTCIIKTSELSWQNILYMSWAYIIVVIWRVLWKVWKKREEKMVRIIEYINKKIYVHDMKTGRQCRVLGEQKKKKEKIVESGGDTQVKEGKGYLGLVHWPCGRSAILRNLPHSLLGISHSQGRLGKSTNQLEAILGFKQWPSHLARGSGGIHY